MRDAGTAAAWGVGCEGSASVCCVGSGARGCVPRRGGWGFGMGGQQRGAAVVAGVAVAALCWTAGAASAGPTSLVADGEPVVVTATLAGPDRSALADYAAA